MYACVCMQPIDESTAIKMIMRRNKVYENWNRIPFYQPEHLGLVSIFTSIHHRHHHDHPHHDHHRYTTTTITTTNHRCCLAEHAILAWRVARAGQAMARVLLGPRNLWRVISCVVDTSCRMPARVSRLRREEPGLHSRRSVRAQASKHPHIVWCVACRASVVRYAQPRELQGENGGNAARTICG